MIPLSPRPVVVGSITGKVIRQTTDTYDKALRLWIVGPQIGGLFHVSLSFAVSGPQFAIVALFRSAYNALWLIGVPPRFIPHCGREASSPVYPWSALPQGS